MTVGDAVSQHMAASPYSTGGGGTVLEHRYTATVLACLLTRDPLPELGDDATPMLVRFKPARLARLTICLSSAGPRTAGHAAFPSVFVARPRSWS